jgi:NADP-dependent 3-hydroxy acid dehydrogenase YdfG
MTSTDFASSMTDIATKEAMEKGMRRLAMPRESIARGVAFAIEQPDDIDVGSIVIRPTASD